MATPPQTVDDYLASLSEDRRAALERVRQIIREAAPGVEEAISYGIPAFRFRRKALLWIGAAASHCALYGVSAPYPGAFEGYDVSGKGTLRFKVDAPLPEVLVRQVVEARIARITA